MNRLQKVWNKVPTKIWVSVCILMYAIIMAVCKKSVDATFCAFAVGFCFLGDVSLNHRRYHKEQTEYDFKVGMIMFLIAHVLYAIAYFVLIERQYRIYLEPGANWLLFMAVLLLLFVLTSTAIEEHMDFGEYELMVVVYTLAIMLDFTMVLFYSNLSKNIHSLAVFGAAALVVSDFLIAYEKFAFEKKSDARIRKMIWILYVGGQILMIANA